MLKLFNQGIQGPKTHIFLVGVGGYHYLKGGDKEKAQVKEAAKLLGQLTSPVVSIVALYEKFISYNAKNEWVKPLGSIELLLTPAPGMPPVLPGENIEQASLANILQAWGAWKTRCNTDKDNVAIFFFCGHGVEKDFHYLLADDFGEIPNQPWRGAFDFDNSRIAFRSCIAETQLFFADACRQVTLDMLEENLVVQPLENAVYGTAEATYYLMLKATSNGEASYGKTNEPSYFTQAIMNGLDGLVARKENNKWQVETNGLQINIHYLMEKVNPKEAYRQRCQPLGGIPAPIVHRAELPKVWLEVSCDPDPALPLASFSCTDVKSNLIDNRAPLAEPWKLNLLAGFYTIKASFPPGTYNNAEQLSSAIPPVTREKLICQ